MARADEITVGLRGVIQIDCYSDRKQILQSLIIILKTLPNKGIPQQMPHLTTHNFAPVAK